LLLIAALILAAKKEITGTIVTAVGAVVDGTGVAFLLARRKEAKDEEDAANHDVLQRCGDSASADQVRPD